MSVVRWWMWGDRPRYDVPPFHVRPRSLRIYIYVMLATTLPMIIGSAVLRPDLWVPRAGETYRFAVLAVVLLIASQRRVQLPSPRHGGAGFTTISPYYYLLSVLLAVEGPAALAGVVSTVASFIAGAFVSIRPRLYVCVYMAMMDFPSFMASRFIYKLTAPVVEVSPLFTLIPVASAYFALEGSQKFYEIMYRVAAGYGGFVEAARSSYPPGKVLHASGTAVSAYLILSVAVPHGTLPTIFSAVACTVILDAMCTLAGRKRSTLKAGHTCALTGLLSHRAMHEELQKLLGGASPVGFILADIDHFKQLNDTRGHLEGDRVLREVALVIRESVSAVDVAARYGGEEFAVIVPGGTLEVVALIAERIRRAVEEECGVTVSIGAAVGLPGADPGKVVDAADAALYASKRGGRNRVTVAPGPVSHAVEEAHITVL